MELKQKLTPNDIGIIEIELDCKKYLLNVHEKYGILAAVDVDNPDRLYYKVGREEHVNKLLEHLKLDMLVEFSPLITKKSFVATESLKNFDKFENISTKEKEEIYARCLYLKNGTHQIETSDGKYEVEIVDGILEKISKTK